MTMSPIPWTRSEVLELLTLIAMIIISSIAAAWHIFMTYKVSFLWKLRGEVTLTSYLDLRSSDSLKRQEGGTQRAVLVILECTEKVMTYDVREATTGYTSHRVTIPLYLN